MKEKAPAALGGQRPDQYHQRSDSTKIQTIKHRHVILEAIADRWVSRGFYRTPARAMLALLEGV